MESEENLSGNNLKPKKHTFYTLNEHVKYNDGSVPTSFGGFQIQKSLDIVNHYRSIYTVLDFLGEIGGLFGILIYLG